MKQVIFYHENIRGSHIAREAQSQIDRRSQGLIGVKLAITGCLGYGVF